MKQVVIHVTNADIEWGERGNAESCAVGLAVRAVLAERIATCANIQVGCHEIEIDERIVCTEPPPAVVDFISWYDATDDQRREMTQPVGAVGGFSFALDIAPEHEHLFAESALVEVQTA